MSKIVGGKEIFFDTGDAVMGQSHNRYLSAAALTWAAATNSCTWPSPGISEITITVPTTASLTSVIVIFDAPNDATEAAWAAAAIVTSTNSDLNYAVVLPNTSRTFIFSNPITRIDFQPQGAACPVFVEAN